MVSLIISGSWSALHNPMGSKSNERRREYHPHGTHRLLMTELVVNFLSSWHHSHTLGKERHSEGKKEQTEETKGNKARNKAKGQAKIYSTRNWSPNLWRRPKDLRLSIRPYRQWAWKRMGKSIEVAKLCLLSLGSFSCCCFGCVYLCTILYRLLQLL